MVHTMSGHIGILAVAAVVDTRRSALCIGPCSGARVVNYGTNICSFHLKTTTASQQAQHAGPTRIVGNMDTRSKLAAFPPFEQRTDKKACQGTG